MYVGKTGFKIYPYAVIAIVILLILLIATIFPEFKQTLIDILGAGR